MRKRRHLRNCKCLLKIYRVNISNWRMKPEQLEHSCSPFPAAGSGSKGRFTPRVNTAYSSKAPLISARLLLIFSHLRGENRSLCDSVAKAAKHAPPGSSGSRARTQPVMLWHWAVVSDTSGEAWRELTWCFQARAKQGDAQWAVRCWE